MHFAFVVTRPACGGCGEWGNRVRRTSSSTGEEEDVRGVVDADVAVVVAVTSEMGVAAGVGVAGAAFADVLVADARLAAETSDDLKSIILPISLAIVSCGKQVRYHSARTKSAFSSSTEKRCGAVRLTFRPGVLSKPYLLASWCKTWSKQVLHVCPLQQ